MTVNVNLLGCVTAQRRGGARRGGERRGGERLGEEKRRGGESEEKRGEKRR